MNHATQPASVAISAAISAAFFAALCAFATSANATQYSTVTVVVTPLAGTVLYADGVAAGNLTGIACLRVNFEMGINRSHPEDRCEEVVTDEDGRFKTTIKNLGDLALDRPAGIEITFLPKVNPNRFNGKCKEEPRSIPGGASGAEKSHQELPKYCAHVDDALATSPISGSHEGFVWKWTDGYANVFEEYAPLVKPQYRRVTTDRDIAAEFTL